MIRLGCQRCGAHVTGSACSVCGSTDLVVGVVDPPDPLGSDGEDHPYAWDTDTLPLFPENDDADDQGE